MNACAAALLDATDQLVERLAPLRFSAPVHTVYQPLIYARLLHDQYVRRFARSGIDALLLGMNPGPFGMAQCGVPFGEVELVREWMGISGRVARPDREHPKRPVLGLDCAKSEVSGRRLWGLMRDRFTTPEAFFAKHFVANWCPLAFMTESGANLTPDKLPAHERAPLEAACDAHLAQVVAAVQPRWIIGVGAFAQQRARCAVPDHPRIATILHPSPASPAANRGWAEQATRQLIALGVWTKSE